MTPPRNALEALQEMLDNAELKQPDPIIDSYGRELDPRLHSYQRQAVNHLWKNPRAGLFLEMGLGKTATTLQAIQPHHLPVLVIAPKRVAENVWNKEVEIWRPDLSVAIAAGTPAKRAQALGAGADITVIGRDNIKDVKPGAFRTIILDELSSFKSRASQRWKIARKICDTAAYVWGLTGTPAPNGLIDLWPQMYLIDSGERLGKTITGYRQRYFIPGRTLSTGVVTEWRVRNESISKIEGLLSDICLSMKAIDHLDLPPVTLNMVSVPMDTKTKKHYEDMLAKLVAELDDRTVMAVNAAVATSKLSQITAGFLYDEDGETNEIHKAKVDAITEIVEGTGSPVLVFYRFKAELANLRAAFPESRTIDEKGIIDDWNAGNVPVLFAHPASAGHGLNLQHGGHTVIWSTLPWSLEEYEQANARLARQGQKNPVVIHHLNSPGTVDEAILSRLINKASVQDALMQALKLKEEE